MAEPWASPRCARLEGLLATHRGNLSAVARARGTSRSHIRRLVARYEIDLDRLRDEDDG